MKEFDKNEFDEIFRAGLTTPDLNEVDEDWELMRARLKNVRNRTLVPYFIFITSAAAVLLIMFTVVFNSDKSEQDLPLVVGKSSKRASPVVQDPFNEQVTTRTVVPEKAPNNATKQITQEAGLIYFSRLDSRNESITPAQTGPVSESQSNTMPVPADTSSSNARLVQPSGSVNAETAVAISFTISAEDPVNSDNLNRIGDQGEADEKANTPKNRLSLAINFAPDLNGVEQFQSNKISYSIGAGLIYNISEKLSIEAGAAYGKKSYQTGFSSFRPASYNLFQVKPNVVSSGFDVMDIQLNLAYTLLKKGKSSIGVGAGISSYLMLDEKYSFTYPNIHARGLSSFHTGYQNNHFLGIANLNLSYKRNLTNNVKLAFNPYLKLPLTELGYGNIRLRSAGMSVGVITDLSKNKK